MISEEVEGTTQVKAYASGSSDPLNFLSGSVRSNELSHSREIGADSAFLVALRIEDPVWRVDTERGSQKGGFNVRPRKSDMRRNTLTLRGSVSSRSASPATPRTAAATAAKARCSFMANNALQGQKMMVPGERDLTRNDFTIVIFRIWKIGKLTRASV